MCISYCHLKADLFFNHEDCSPQVCKYAQIKHPSCDTCHHLQGDVCGLTRCPRPSIGGCCHWNVELISGLQPITLADVQMLGVGVNETICDVLAGFDVAYEVDAQGQVWLDLDRLALPEIFGWGNNH